MIVLGETSPPTHFFLRSSLGIDPAIRNGKSWCLQLWIARSSREMTTAVVSCTNPVRTRQ